MPRAAGRRGPRRHARPPVVAPGASGRREAPARQRSRLDAARTRRARPRARSRRRRGRPAPAGSSREQHGGDAERHLQHRERRATAAGLASAVPRRHREVDEEARAGARRASGAPSARRPASAWAGDRRCRAGSRDRRAPRPRGARSRRARAGRGARPARHAGQPLAASRRRARGVRPACSLGASTRRPARIRSAFTRCAVLIRCGQLEQHGDAAERDLRREQGEQQPGEAPRAPARACAAQRQRRRWRRAAR